MPNELETLRDQLRAREDKAMARICAAARDHGEQSISGTTIITPYASGLYRINIYLALTASGNNVTVGASVGWTDASGGSRTFSTAAINFSTGANNPQLTSITVYATSAAAITYSTTVSGGVGAGTYQLAIAVEKLS